MERGLGFITRLLERIFPTGPAPVNADLAQTLLARASASLEAFLSSHDPMDIRTLSATRHKYDHIHRLYAALGQFGFDHRDARFPFDGLPTARDLFWDCPNTDLQRRCLEDAEALFAYLQDAGPTQQM